MRTGLFIITSLLLGFNLMAADAGPFSVSSALSESDNGELLLSVSFSIQDHYYLYAEQIKVEATGSKELLPKKIPHPKQKYDASTGTTVGVYTQDTTFIYAVKRYTGAPIDIKVSYQGCSEKMCFLPATQMFSLTVDRKSRVIPRLNREETELPAVQLTEDWRKLAEHFTVAGRAAGYLNAEKMMRFLDTAESGDGLSHGSLGNVFKEKGIWISAILILLGGLALNLTPCVLPMIPINIAIIGAGANTGSKTRGLALGGAYGIAMAAVYGVLGLIVVLTGSKFGALNASPLFNAIVAVIFLLLSLAMFGVFTIDFSRFQGTAAVGKSKRGNIFIAFSFGAVAALLAGACVAPVLISVLLLSANLYAQNNPAGLVLPFLLGIGMGLPWPFVGAGLSLLPKPGKWMNHVKYAFGVIIIGFSFYYGMLTYRLLMNRSRSSKERVKAAQQASINEGWYISLASALKQAREEKKPVFIDFWASWCKSCLVMEKTTFKHPNVRNRLEKYVRVKFRAENLKDSTVKSVLDNFGVIGLPTYVVLVPNNPKFCRSLTPLQE